MKKIIMMTIAAAACACMTGCDPVEKSADIDKSWTDHGSACWTKVVTIENHKYVILYGIRLGSIVHAASCECMNGRK